MCGILGIVGKHNIIEGIKILRRLEYRGYDSFGFATSKGFLFKAAGSIEEKYNYIISKYNFNDILSIYHTRWATHGEVNDINAHPHHDCNKKIFVVHNGVIENYEDLKEELKGHKFYSQTDTEVIAHFIEDRLNKGKKMEEIIEEMFEKFEGYYSLLILYKNKLYAVKNGEPLIIGEGKDKYYISSDLYSIYDKIDEYFTLDDYEYVKINPISQKIKQWIY